MEAGADSRYSAVQFSTLRISVSNLLLPLGSLVYLLFCVSKRGWGWKNFTEEANTGKGLKIQKWMRVYITYILPR